VSRPVTSSRGPYIRMHSGRKVYLLDPEWYMPDVAWHASHVRRYTGASDFSIGQHMIVGARMAERFYPNEKLLPARFLAHDAPEAVYNDMSSPMKRLLPDYTRVLADGEHSFEKFADITWLDDPLTKELDTRMWLTERLMVYREAHWEGVDTTEDVAWCDLEPFPLTSDEMHDLFLPWHPSLVRTIYTTEFQRHLPWVEWA
jgi:hypothetical protein